MIEVTHRTQDGKRLVNKNQCSSVPSDCKKNQKMFLEDRHQCLQRAAHAGMSELTTVAETPHLYRGHTRGVLWAFQRTLQNREKILCKWSRLEDELVDSNLPVLDLLKKILLNAWRQPWLVKLHKLQAYSSIIYHLCTVLCVHHPK